MFLKKFFRLLKSDDGNDGGGGSAEDRGDFLPNDVEAAAAAQAEADAAAAAEADALAAAEAEALKAKPKAKAPAPADKAPEGEDGGDEDADDKDEKGGKGAKNARIPLSRHEAVLAKERERSAALAAEVAQLKARGNLSATAEATADKLTEMDAQVAQLEDEYATQLTDGKTKEATATMAKIRALERTASDARSDLKIAAATQSAREESVYSTALSRVEAAYPVLNPDHEDYDQAMEGRVVRLSAANLAGGMTRTAALQDAVEAILGAATTAQERATTVTPNADPTAVAAARKAAAVTKTVKAVGATPPSTSKIGIDSDKEGGKLTAQAVIKMNQSSFAKLAEADLAELRGDTV